MSRVNLSLRKRMLLAAVQLAIILRGRRKDDPTRDELREHLWQTSTDRMGLRFTETIRDAWRGRWLKLRRHEKRG